MEKEDQAASGRQSVQSAEVAMEVLKGLSRLGGAASLSGLAGHLGLTGSKTHRYLASLINTGLVWQDAATGRYMLGQEAIKIGLSAIRQSDVLSFAQQALLELRDRHGVSCFAAVMGNRGPTIVRWEDSPHPVAVNVRVGSVMPILWSATGRVFGAWLQNDEVAAQVREELAGAGSAQRQAFPDAAAARRLFETVRALGCAPLRDEMLSGISAVSTPIFNFEGKIVAALTALGPTGYFDPDPQGIVGLAVREAATGVSERLGYSAA